MTLKGIPLDPFPDSYSLYCQADQVEAAKMLKRNKQSVMISNSDFCTVSVTTSSISSKMGQLNMAGNAGDSGVGGSDSALSVTLGAEPKQCS